jgi:hypothetical protein
MFFYHDAKLKKKNERFSLFVGKIHTFVCLQYGRQTMGCGQRATDNRKTANFKGLILFFDKFILDAHSYEAKLT